MKLAAESQRYSLGCDDAKALAPLANVLKSFVEKKAGSSDNRFYQDRKTPRISRLSLEPLRDSKEFLGNPDPAKIYQYRRENGISNAPPILTGRCVFCSVLCSWGDVEISGSEQAPTLLNPRIKQPADITCNCPRCGHDWKVIAGNVVTES